MALCFISIPRGEIKSDHLKGIYIFKNAEARHQLLLREFEVTF